jgi:parallel beta-helix repeat protein
VDANGAVNTGGAADRIEFNIAGTGMHTISLASNLPNITDAVIIDGFTQPGSQPNTLPTDNNTVWQVTIDGAPFSTCQPLSGDGLVVASTGSGTMIRGLRVVNFGPAQIIVATGASNVRVVGNYVGDSDGANYCSGDGVFVRGNDNFIGGTNPGDRNVIKFNGRAVNLFGSSRNTVQGNIIENSSIDAILIKAGSGNLIGGTAAGAGNVISRSLQIGIKLGFNNRPGTAGPPNVIQGNFIGTGFDGASDRGNGASGIFVDGEFATVIGGTEPGAGNLIAFNLHGINVTARTRATILGNSIFSNLFLGIELQPNLGVDANDALDADGGANAGQNYPVLNSATSTTASTTIAGSLASSPDTTFRVELFSSSSCDSHGNGQGRRFLGATDVTTNAAGDATIDATLPVTVANGQVVTSTATDPSGNTSEFSRCVTVTNTGGGGGGGGGGGTATGLNNVPLRDVQLLRSLKTVQGITLQFDAALDAAQATNVGNYRVASSPGKDKQWGNADDKPATLASATYAAASHTVTLNLVKPLKKGLHLTVFNAADPADATPTAGDDFNRVAVWGAKASLVIAGRRVSLGLKGGGVFEALLSPAQQIDLRLHGTVAGRSVLSGTSTGAGTAIEITNLTVDPGSMFRSTLAAPFQIGPLPQNIVDELLAASGGTLQAVLLGAV